MFKLLKNSYRTCDAPVELGFCFHLQTAWNLFERQEQTAMCNIKNKNRERRIIHERPQLFR